MAVSIARTPLRSARTLNVSARRVPLTGAAGMPARGSRFAGVENRALRRVGSRSVLGSGYQHAGRGSRQ